MARGETGRDGTTENWIRGVTGWGGVALDGMERNGVGRVGVGWDGVAEQEKELDDVEAGGTKPWKVGMESG